jgi:hypothetical protein
MMGLDFPATADLFLIGVAPGAPLMVRTVGKKGFDMHLDFSYQLWGGLLPPLVVPQPDPAPPESHWESYS